MLEWFLCRKAIEIRLYITVLDGRVQPILVREAAGASLGPLAKI